MSRTGTVRVSYGGHGVVRLDDGETLDAKFRRGVGRPCCGDRVEVRTADAGSVVVTAIAPRRNRFMRADGRGRPVTVAANLDEVMIVIAPRPAPSRDLLERYLVAVHSLEIEPVIVVNKVDLLARDEAGGQPPFDRLEAYAALGYAVFQTSCKAPPGVEALAAGLGEGTGILVGQSGVGKSSLVNRLVPDLALQTGALSRATGKGTHTTTATSLYDRPGGGHLIDSPGVWEFGIWRMDPEELARGFIEFRPWLGRCRFNDCRHASEPGCAVKQAVEEGAVARWRHEAYLRLLEQNAG